MDSELTHIGLIQLFYELKQFYPSVPDQIVTSCIRQAEYDKQAALQLLAREAVNYCSVVGQIRKMSQETSPTSGRNPFRIPPQVNGSQTPTDGQRIPPPIPSTPPVGPGFPSPPVYTSPRYRPDIDLSVPPVMHPDGNSRMVQMYYGANSSQVVAYPSPTTPNGEQKRGSTSVSLVLQQPSPEQQQPVTAPGYVSYTAASMDPQRGLHSQVKITISPQGGCVSAVRTSSNSSLGSPQIWYQNVGSPSTPRHELAMPQWPSNPQSHTPVPIQSPVVAAERLPSQIEKRERMRSSLEQDRRKLEELRKTVERLQEELTREKNILGQTGDQPPIPHRNHQLEPTLLAGMEDLQRLRQEIHSLRLDCQRMVRELDDYSNERGVANGPISTTATSSTTRGVVPPEENDEEGGGWNCSTCTFRNHPALDKCEQCEMPRPAVVRVTGPSSGLQSPGRPDLSSPITAFGGGGGGVGFSSFPSRSSTSNIHIHVRHRHVASSTSSRNVLNQTLPDNRFVDIHNQRVERILETF